MVAFAHIDAVVAYKFNVINYLLYVGITNTGDETATQLWTKSYKDGGPAASATTYNIPAGGQTISTFLYPISGLPNSLHIEVGVDAAEVVVDTEADYSATSSSITDCVNFWWESPCEANGCYWYDGACHQAQHTGIRNFSGQLTIDGVPAPTDTEIGLNNNTLGIHCTGYVYAAGLYEVDCNPPDGAVMEFSVFYDGQWFTPNPSTVTIQQDVYTYTINLVLNTSTNQKDETWSGISIIVVVEGLADVHDVVYPVLVQANEPFTITYKVTNTGNTDTLWGGLYADGVTGTPVTPPGGTNTYWAQTINSGQTIDVTISYPIGITTSIAGYELRVGHQIFG